MPELYFEDFTPGRVFAVSETCEVTAESIKRFAAEYDPQPFHLDEAAANASFFQGLTASGWQTAAIAMGIRARNVHVAGGMIGAGVSEIVWNQPVRPGDTLHTEEQVLSARRLLSRPSYGEVRAQTTVLNQRGEVVMRAKVKFIAPVRNSES